MTASYKWQHYLNNFKDYGIITLLGPAIWFQFRKKHTIITLSSAFYSIPQTTADKQCGGEKKLGRKSNNEIPVFPPKFIHCADSSIEPFLSLQLAFVKACLGDKKLFLSFLYSSLDSFLFLAALVCAGYVIEFFFGPLKRLKPNQTNLTT